MAVSAKERLEARKPVQARARINLGLENVKVSPYGFSGDPETLRISPLAVRSHT
jgi:hypothetical protein